MADLVAGAIIDVGKKLIKTLNGVKDNKRDGQKLQELIDLVKAVCIDVTPEHVDARMKTDRKVTIAMTKMMEALVEAKSEVDAFLKKNIFMKAFLVDDMTKKLVRLRQNIKDTMDVSLHATVNETNKDVKENQIILLDISHRITDLGLQREQVQNNDTRGGTSGVAGKPPPRVWTPEELREKQQYDTIFVSKALSIPSGVAAVLLRHLNWVPERVHNKWIDSGESLRQKVGLPSSSEDVSRPKKIGGKGCTMCFDDTSRVMISAGCSHYYCKNCWCGYISAALGNGQRRECLSLRCLDPSCQMPVTQDLVDMVVVDTKERELYDNCKLLSYVDDSRGRIKWCPGPDCDRAVEVFLDGAGAKDNVVVACDLKHSFCWNCCEEPHRPVSCDTALLWLDTIISREDYVLMFIKRCPKCRKIIENVSGSNNVTCSAPCFHRFCWVCLQPLGGSNHTAGCFSYRDAGERALQYFKEEVTSACEQEKKRLLTTKKQENQKAMASDYYKLWADNQVVLEQMENVLKTSEISNMAANLSIPVADLNFLSEAYEAIVECRRLIRWVYPYGYYHLDWKRDGGKSKDLNRLHHEANESLKCLQNLAELKNQLYDYYNFITEDGIIIPFEPEKKKKRCIDTIKTKVMGTTKKTRDKVEKLVEALETYLED